MKAALTMSVDFNTNAVCVTVSHQNPRFGATTYTYAPHEAYKLIDVLNIEEDARRKALAMLQTLMGAS